MGNLMIECAKGKRGSRTYDGPVNFMHFTVLKSIGRGSYGKVCIAVKRDTGKKYAMKYMNKFDCIRKGAVQNILQELRILRRIQHSNIVNLRYAFHDREDMCLVMDVLQGGDLRYHINKNGHFVEHDVILYMAEIGSALEYLRMNNIIHRDVKPENILLDDDGHAHLTDFNAACVVAEENLPSMLCGTWQYMAPEIAAVSIGEVAGYSYHVDWWSLGITCYEAYTGELPFLVPKSAEEVVAMFRDCTMDISEDKFPLSIHLLKGLLCPDPEYRLCQTGSKMDTALRQLSRTRDGEVKHDFVPKTSRMNVDPLYELEEVIMETNSIYQKHSRLAKRASRSASPIDNLEEADAKRSMLEMIEEEFVAFDCEENDDDSAS